MKNLLTLILVTLCATAVFSQKNNPWKDVPESSFSRKAAERRIVPDQYRTLSLDLQKIQAVLANASLRFSEGAEANAPVLPIPMPELGYENFHVVEAPIMHPDLAAKYPEIRSYAGWSDDDPTAYLRFGVTQRGFHAVVFSARHSTVYIDAYAVGDTEHYVCYFKKDCSASQTFECHTEAPSQLKTAENDPESLTRMAGDCQLRSFQLALACTGEYAQFHGGTKPLVMAEFNVAMTRINGIYEREAAVTMVLVPDTDDLIFLNAGTDPYTNDDGFAMLGENQTTCDNVIGSANYDIGHVFSTGGGGVAALGAVCFNGSKAEGVTGLNSPVGDPFYVDYVAHEMGHQYGGNHTFNSNVGSCNGNQNNSTAMEPGSGTTIQAYAGICGSHNLQNNSDDYFHAISLDEILAHVTGSGGNCATDIATTNEAPSVTVPNGFYNVPVSTPFVLTALGDDPDPDGLTYCWEQMNNQTATMPPLPTNTVGPAFRSFLPAESPSRYFPNLPAIISGTTPTWERLPSVTRVMNFRCTVRDNHPGAGCTNEADVQLNFSANAGPFVVTAPNGPADEWTSLATEPVTWNVANTTAAPVSTSAVDIYLSVDGGLTYPYLLIQNTPNDGTQQVTVPNVQTTMARVMVKGRDNVFFDISNQNFPITAPLVPTFTLSTDPMTASSCGEDVSYNISLQPILGFNQPVNFSITSAPPGLGITFSPAPVTPPGSTTMTVSGAGNLSAGTYSIAGLASGPLGAFAQINVSLVVQDSITGTVTAPSPADGSTGLSPLAVGLSWGNVAGATSYLVEVALNPSFQTILATATVNQNSFEFTSGAQSTVYYWRVKPLGPCNDGGFSATFSFQTADFDCQQVFSSDVPVSIPETGLSTVSSDLTMPNLGQVVSVDVYLEINHTWVGDLDAMLISPNNTSVTLFDRPGVPASDFGCDGNDLEVGFSPVAPNSAADFENACNPTTPTISGDYQPIGLFSAFYNQQSSGNWTLEVSDFFDGDGGAITFWYLEMCGGTVLPAANLLANETLSVPNGQTGTVSQNHLETQGPVANVVYTLLAVPANGTLYLNGAPLAIGGQFTQQQVNSELVTYTHDGSLTQADQFLFDVLAGGQYWLHDQVFNIEILENTLAATAALTQGLDCHGDTDATITVAASGGIAPLGYSLNGGPSQPGNVFTNLGPGTYTPTVQDANGFTFTTNIVTVSEPSAITVTASVVVDDLTVNASGGTGSLAYGLNGTDYQASNLFANLSNGIYTVYVRDANGCVETATAVVAVNTILVSLAISQQVSCFGENDGVVTATAGGGNPPYMYSLNGGSFQAGNVFGNLVPGIYTVTLMDEDGLTQSSNSVTVTQPTAITGSAGASGYTVSVSASGGTGSLSYSLDGGPFQAGNQFFPVPGGSHSVTVMDGNGCTAVFSVGVNVAALGATLNFTQMLDCADSNDGQITVTATGGVPPYEYRLNGGIFQMSNVFNGLSVGSYTVEIRDSGGFTFVLPPANIAAPPALMASGQVFGNDVTVTATGGTAPYQYSLDGGIFQSGNMFENLPNGLHIITVVDANGCDATTSVTVNFAVLTLTASITQSPSCPGDADAVITITATGGTPLYEYSLNGVDFQAGNVFSGLSAGIYTPTVKDADGNVSTAPAIVVSDPPAIVATGSAFGPEITVAATGGTGGYQYSLDGGPLQPENLFEVVFNGTYTVTVMDEKGCTAQVEVLVNKPEDVLFDVTGASCPGVADGAISIEGVEGGYPPYTFSLNGGPFTPELDYDGLDAGVYVIFVMDATGYIFEAPAITIEAPQAIGIDAEIEDNTLTINASGGTPGFLYSIDGGANFQASGVFPDLPNGTYDVVVMDENGCLQETTVTINYNAAGEANRDLPFEVRPNPSAGIFTLKMGQPSANGRSLVVHDVAGRRVFGQMDLAAGQTEYLLDLRFLPNGVYQLQVWEGGQWGVARLVVLK